MILFLIGWYLIGLISGLLGDYFFDDQITLKGFFGWLLRGLFGPPVIIVAISHYLDQKPDTILIKRKVKK